MSLAYLDKILKDKKFQLEKDFPEVKSYLDQRQVKIEDFRNRPAKDTIDIATSLPSPTLSTLQNDPAVAQVSSEEHEAIFLKMQEAVLKPSATWSRDSQLYLEQQLTDLFGFDTVSSLEDRVLPFMSGTIEAEPHKRRFSDDGLELHVSCTEAGLSPIRSGFGWFSNSFTPTPQEQLNERFGVSLPLFMLPEWSSDYQAVKNWFWLRKVVVINPLEKKAVVANVYDIKTHRLSQYQFGGSPELIRTGDFWSPNSKGRCLMFLIDDPKNQVKLGPI